MKKKLMIDMDDTITLGGVLDIVNEYLGTNYQEGDCKDYFVQSLIPEDKIDGFADFFYERNLYDYTTLAPNVVEVLKQLNDKYDIYILSAYILKDSPEKASNHLRNKYNFLVKTFPFLNPKKFIFTCDKSIVNGDIVIDDLPKNLYSKYKMRILFNSYHNSDIVDKEIIRVNSWLEIQELLEDIYE